LTTFRFGTGRVDKKRKNHIPRDSHSLYPTICFSQIEEDFD
jgi:hypothetical protein